MHKKKRLVQVRRRPRLRKRARTLLAFRDADPCLPNHPPTLPSPPPPPRPTSPARAPLAVPQLFFHGRPLPVVLQHHGSFFARDDARHVRGVRVVALPAEGRACAIDGGLLFPQEERLGACKTAQQPVRARSPSRGAAAFAPRWWGAPSPPRNPWTRIFNVTHLFIITHPSPPSPRARAEDEPCLCGVCERTSARRPPRSRASLIHLPSPLSEAHSARS